MQNLTLRRIRSMLPEAMLADRGRTLRVEVFGRVSDGHPVRVKVGDREETWHVAQLMHSTIQGTTIADPTFVCEPDIFAPHWCDVCDKPAVMPYYTEYSGFEWACLMCHYWLRSAGFSQPLNEQVYTVRPPIRALKALSTSLQAS